MSVSLKSKVDAIRYDGFNMSDIEDFAGKVNWEVYPEGSTNGHPNLVAHGVYFMGYYTADKYEYLQPGDWLIQAFDTLHALSDEHIGHHFSGLPKKDYEPYATHESDVITRDVEDAVVPEPSWRAKTKPSEIANNKFGDPANHELVKQATANWDAEMKNLGYTYKDKAVDSRTGSRTPSATPGATGPTPVPDDVNAEVIYDQSATENLPESTSLSPAAEGAADSLAHNRTMNENQTDPFTTISEKGRQVNEGKVPEDAPEDIPKAKAVDEPEPDSEPEKYYKPSKSAAKKSTK